MRRLTVVGLLAAACLWCAPLAAATEVQWRLGGSLGAGSRDASPSYQQFRASAAVADCSCHAIDASAHYPGGWTQYAGWAEGLGNACHSYAGTDTLGALIMNPHTVTQNPVTAWLRYMLWEVPC